MHTAFDPQAYGGFKPWSTIKQTGLKPGETLRSLDTKFGNVGYGVVYLEGPDVETKRDATVAQLSMSQPENEHYQVPDRRGVSAQWEGKAYNPKPFLGKSMYLSTFRDPKGASSAGINVPEWVVSAKRVNTDVVAREEDKSSHQIDMGRGLRGPMAVREFPMDRPFMVRGGMKGTTEDLNTGTTKATFRIPGYAGHQPASQQLGRVTRAQAHGEGEEARRATSLLRLYHRHNMPGYTGAKQPLHPRNDLGEMRCGTHPSTTAGASALGMVL